MKMSEVMMGLEPTIEELKLLKLAYIQQGAALFTDLALVVRRLGLECTGPKLLEPGYTALGMDRYCLFEVEEVSALWRERRLASSVFCEEMTISVGKPMMLVREIMQPGSTQAWEDQALLREDVVCRLKRFNLHQGERTNTGKVEVDADDARFIPGRWMQKILAQLDYAQELTQSMHEMRLEKERLALLDELMIGRVV